MPLIQSQSVATTSLDCSNLPDKHLLLCRIFPMGRPFDVTAILEKGQADHSRNLVRRIHVQSSDSADGIVYIAAVVLLYLVIFVAILFAQSRRRTFAKSNKGRRSRKSSPLVLLECPNDLSGPKCSSVQCGSSVKGQLV